MPQQSVPENQCHTLFEGQEQPDGHIIMACPTSHTPDRTAASSAYFAL
jgi:hypothetical protein